MPNWAAVLNEINQETIMGQQAAAEAPDRVRRKYLKKLHKLTGRNVIAYYSGWLSKPKAAQTQIMDEDKNGFMVTIHGMDRKLGVDLLLHTPGGDMAATESIIHYLRKMFGRNIRAIVPQLAMSGGTMIACSAKEIVMGTHSNLGPIDPQFNGIPAYGVIQEFQRAYRECKKDPAKMAVWQPIIGKYSPTFLSQCENVTKWGQELVKQQLIEVMFFRQRNAKAKARKAVNELNDYSGNKSHARHIHTEELKKMGLKITALEKDDDLQDLVLTVHHAYMHTLMNTPAFKIIENHNGVAMVKKQQMVAVPAPVQMAAMPEGQP